MLCQRKCRNDPEDLEGVLPVLDRRLYDGGDGGVVLRARFRAEASADLEFGLGRPQGLLAVVVRGRDGGVREEGEDVVPVFGDAFLELVQFGAVPVLFRVDRRRASSSSSRASIFFHVLAPTSLWFLRCTESRRRSSMPRLQASSGKVCV